MLDMITVLTYLITHDPGHTDRLQLSVKHPKQAVQLEWGKIPPEAHSLAVVIKDASQNHPHYYGVLYNLPPESHHVLLDRHFHVNAHYWGKNSWGDGQFHAEFFGNKPVLISVYALDEKFSVHYPMTGQELERHMKGHVVAKAQAAG